MILIADSGSTKTDWIVLNDQPEIEHQFTTKGLNPNVISFDAIFNLLITSPEIEKLIPQVNKLFFYGSGCGSEKNSKSMHATLKSVFTKSIIEVKSDLYAAAYATSGIKGGIVCILGTGSNSCFYNGRELSGGNFSLGYLLGDEGSGFYFGKRLLRDYFYGILPNELKEKFAEAYPISREDLIRKVYQESYPNQFIASFVPFLKENINHPYCNYLINFGFDEFIKIFITTIPNYKLWPVHFVGSVADAFHEQLIASCKANDLVEGNIIASPALSLANYHIMMEKR